MNHYSGLNSLQRYERNEWMTCRTVTLATEAVVTESVASLSSAQSRRAHEAATANLNGQRRKLTDALLRYLDHGAILDKDCALIAHDIRNGRLGPPHP